MSISPTLKLFIIYAREDQPALLELKAHLRPLEKRGELTVWYDGEILPGEKWDDSIKAQLGAADIVLLFISKHFFNSEYIEREELKMALERHRKGEIIVVPIIVEPCLWKAAPEIKTFQVLPKDAKPVSRWENPDEAWVNVAEDVLLLIEQHYKYRQPENHYPKQIVSLSKIEKNLPRFEQENLDLPYESMGRLARQVLKQVEEISHAGIISGVPSGFIDIDRLTSGWQPSDLIILAARPGLGKTSMGLSMALNAAKDFGKTVALFSLEMSGIQIINRLISMEAEIGVTKIRTALLQDYEWQQFQATVELLESIPIYIDDTPAINIFELRTRCRQLKLQQDIQLVIIDYLQLIASSNSDEINKANREHEIAIITRGLKNLARELNVPVIAISQLSRNVELRGGSKKPQLSDLRDFGPIEADADIVAFLYRPEYYQILEDENGQSLRGIAEFIVAKNRHGALDTIKLKFIDRIAKFTNLDEPIFEGLENPLSDSVISTRITPRSIMNDDDIPF